MSKLFFIKDGTPTPPLTPPTPLIPPPSPHPPPIAPQFCHAHRILSPRASGGACLRRLRLSPLSTLGPETQLCTRCQELGSWDNFCIMAVAQTCPKRNPGKWNQGLKPAVPWRFNLDPCPYTWAVQRQSLGHQSPLVLVRCLRRPLFEQHDWLPWIWTRGVLSQIRS